MTRRGPARVWAAVLGLMVCLGAVVPGVPAQAAESAAATVAIDSVTPSVTLDGQVTIQGTVTNSGTVPLFTVQVMTCREPAPLRTRSELRAALARDPEAATCLRATTLGSFVTISAEGSPWRPKATSPFSVTTKVSDLQLSTAGVYVVGVQVRGSTDGSANYATVGRGRTLVPVTSPNVTPTAIHSVAWLTSRPSLLRPGVLVDDHLAQELTGRLSQLMTAAQTSGASWAIDPALYWEVATMAKGYTLADGTVGSGQAAAAAWLTRFSELPKAAGYRIPYGNPDLALATSAGGSGVIDQAIAATAQVPEVAGLPMIVRAPNGRADAAFLDAVKRFAPAVVVADTSRGPVALTSTAGVVAATEPDAFAGGPGPDERDTPVQHRQRMLSASLIAAIEGTGGVVRVLDDPALADYDAAAQAPWQGHQPLSTLSPAAAWVPALSTGAPAGPLGSTVLTVIERYASILAVYGDLTGNAALGSQLSARTLAPVASASWATDDQAIAYAAATTARYTALDDGIRVRVASRVVMTARTNAFPVTVTNTLPDPVHVKVQFSSQNPQRLTVPDTAVVVVGSGESATLNAAPVATANGSVDLVAQVSTAQGVPVGTPQKFAINVTEAGKVGWVIVIASGIVVVAATVLRIRAVARSRRAGETA